MENKLYIVGIGPGDAGFVYPAVRDIIESADVIIGGERNLEAFNGLKAEKIAIGRNLEEIGRFIHLNLDSKKIVVLASGDPGLYSIMEFLKRELPGIRLEVLPGISSLQYLCSRMGLSWDDIRITSVHGREQNDLLEILRTNPKVAVFTGGGHTADFICRRLAASGIKGITVTVGENLSYENERIVTGSSEEIANMQFESLSIMIVQNKLQSAEIACAWQYTTAGIPDAMFIRGDVPMTKEEIRTVSLAKLRLKENSIVFDIGAGTGSVSIECSLACRKGFVYAIEKDADALELIKKNAEKFGTQNLSIIAGEAPEALEVLEKPDRIFIGGTGGNMESLFDWIDGRCENVRVVANTVTLESTYEAVKEMEKCGFANIEMVQVSVSHSRAAGSKHMLQAHNPVYIISGEKGDR